MNIPTGLTRTDLAVAGISGAALAGTALHYGLPLWLVMLGAAPVLTFQLVGWLAGYRDATYARTHRDADAAVWAAVETALADADRIVDPRAGAR